MDWNIKITKAQNGYICEWEEQTGDGILKRKTVFEEGDDRTGELTSIRDMLWFVKEHFGIFRNKHNKVNLNIKLETKA